MAKKPTYRYFNYSQAKSYAKSLSRDAEDYEVIAALLGVSAGAVGGIIGFLGTWYLRRFARKVEDVVDTMKPGDTLVVKTTWKYISQGKNKRGYVPDKTTVYKK